MIDNPTDEELQRTKARLEHLRDTAGEPSDTNVFAIAVLALEAYEREQYLGAQKPRDYTWNGQTVPARLTWLSGGVVATVLRACRTGDQDEALRACQQVKWELKEI